MQSYAYFLYVKHLGKVTGGNVMMIELIFAKAIIAVLMVVILLLTLVIFALNKQISQNFKKDKKEN